MKVAVFGDKMMILNVTASLAGLGVEVISSLDRRKAMTLWQQEKFDLALVDGLMVKLVRFCCLMRQTSGVPVVLMLRRRKADWRKMQSLDPDGYVFYEERPHELIAKLRAVVRRCLPSNGE